MGTIRAKTSKPKLKPHQFLWREKTHEMPTLIPDMPNAEYHGSEFKDFLGHSGIVKLGISPAHFKAYQESHTQTPAMAFGTAAHIVMLEEVPENLFDPKDKIAICDVVNKAGLPVESWASKAAEEFKENAFSSGFEAVVLQKEWTILQMMKKQLMCNRWAHLAINNSIIEHSGFFMDNMFDGVKGRIRLDCWRKDHKLIGDYKTAQSAQERDFATAVMTYGYDIQAYWYVHGMKVITGDDYDFMFIVQEKAPPFAVNCFIASDLLLKCGEIRTNRALTTYWNCEENPDLYKKAYDYYENKIFELDPPAWAIRQYGVVMGKKEVEPEELLIKPLELPTK